MRSCTTAVASMEFKQDSMSLNGEEQDLQANKRFDTVLKLLRSRAQTITDPKDPSRVLIAKEDWPKYRLRIVSENNFPTAAGLASSASGFACLTKCLATLFGVEECVQGELSSIARQGSGSSCRSLYGGWVAWDAGCAPDGSDSLARQVADEAHWPEMRVLIIVVNRGRKETSSTSGMAQTVDTSPLLKYRVDVIVPQRMKDMEKAIQTKDFEAFADLTMADSNQFHAVCLDTMPPIFYLNDTSKRIIHMVHAINSACGRRVVAYTFDAGPNAVLYLLEKDMNAVLDTFLQYFLPDEVDIATFVTDRAGLSRSTEFKIISNDEDHADQKEVRERRFMHILGERDLSYKVARIIVSKLGAGAKTTEYRHTFQ